MIKKSIPCTSLNLFDEEPKAHGAWRSPIKEQLAHLAAASVATLINFININGILYYKGSEGVLSWCIGAKEACLKLDKYHKIWYGEESLILYRRIYRTRYYWPSMAKDASHLQAHCPKCFELPKAGECNFVTSTGDWRRPYIDYLKNDVLPTNSTDAELVKARQGNISYMRMICIGSLSRENPSNA